MKVFLTIISMIGIPIIFFLVTLLVIVICQKLLKCLNGRRWWEITWKVLDMMFTVFIIIIFIATLIVAIISFYMSTYALLWN